MTLVIMAAGMGSRYGGMKQVEPIGAGGEFIIDYSIYDAIKAGFDRVAFIIKEENKDIFEQTVGSRIKGIEKVYAFQSVDDIPAGFSVPEGRVKPWGTAHAVLAASSVIGDGSEDFVVINSDDFYGSDSFMSAAEFLRDGKKDEYCMVGFVLKNTLTENGTVSRGVCESDREGYLLEVTERTKIKKIGTGTAFTEDGEKWEPLDENCTVSMNMWGFRNDFFKVLESGFTSFMALDGDPLKKEYYLPYAVKLSLEAGKRVKVLSTGSKWYGITYKEDREIIKQFIASEVEAGRYPKKLWEQ